MTEKDHKNFTDDRFPQMLGMDLQEISPGYARVAMKIREQMLNFQDMAHGGAVFALADTAFGLAVNTRGPAVAMQVSISYLQAAKAESILTAEAQEVSMTRKTATYDVTVKNDTDETVALFRGLAYRK